MRLDTVELDRLDIKSAVRSSMDPKKVLSLKNSIAAKGIIQPIIAIAANDGFKVVDGVIRLRIVKELGWDKKKKIDVVIIDDQTTTPLETALLLNSLREELTPLDEARIINDLINVYGYKKDDVSRMLGKSETKIDSLLRVFRLPPNILRALKDGQVTLAHCRQLARVQDDQRILDITFNKTINENLTPRDLEILVSHQLDIDSDDDYRFFPPFVVKTKAGSRIRFEPRRKSVRMELNVVSEDLGDVVKEMKSHLRTLAQGHLKSVG